MSEINKEKLRKVLKKFNEDLGVYINEDQRYKLGQVLTIIDASISDHEQRKAIKDLIQAQWWNHGPRESRGIMENPHTDLRGICLSFGFNLYEEPNAIIEDSYRINSEEFAAKRYKKVAEEE